jgi:hypothetical protein
MWLPLVVEAADDDLAELAVRDPAGDLCAWRSRERCGSAGGRRQVGTHGTALWAVTALMAAAEIETSALLSAHAGEAIGDTETLVATRMQDRRCPSAAHLASSGRELEDLLRVMWTIKRTTVSGSSGGSSPRYLYERVVGTRQNADEPFHAMASAASALPGGLTSIGRAAHGGSS